MSCAADRGVGEVLDAARAATGAAARADLAPRDGVDALAVARELEVSGRQVRAAQIGLLDEIDRRGLHKGDGHASAKVMVRFACNLSDAEALRRAKAARALRHVPTIRERFVQGRIGMCQVDRIARVFANPRVRDQLIDVEADVAVVAMMLPYREFDQRMTDWERLADEDGAGDQAERDHERRDYRIGRNLNGSAFFDGGVGPLQAAELREVHEHYTEMELTADWAEARERLGGAATYEDLQRTDAQRRADAQVAISRDAAAFQADRPGGSIIVANVVIDLPTFERQLERACRDEPNANSDPRLATFFRDTIDDLDLDHSDDHEVEAEPLHDPRRDAQGDADAGRPAASAGPAVPTGRDHPQGPADAGPPSEANGPAASSTPSEPGRADPEPDAEVRPDARGIGFRCGTLDGHPLDPAEVAAAALIGRVRRVVVGADGVVLDMSRIHRFFTGPRQLAVFLSESTCYWTGCNTPGSWCQADHLDAFNGPRRGSTNPGNGGPACGRHNRFKEHGFTVHRDERGRWHIYRPDGTEIV